MEWKWMHSYSETCNVLHWLMGAGPPSGRGLLPAASANRECPLASARGQASAHQRHKAWPLVSQRAPLYCFCVSLHGSGLAGVYKRAGRLGGEQRRLEPSPLTCPTTHISPALAYACMFVRLRLLPCVFFICHPHLYIHLLKATATHHAPRFVKD